MLLNFREIIRYIGASTIIVKINKQKQKYYGAIFLSNYHNNTYVKF